MTHLHSPDKLVYRHNPANALEGKPPSDAALPAIPLSTRAHDYASDIIDFSTISLSPWPASRVRFCCDARGLGNCGRRISHSEAMSATCTIFGSLTASPELAQGVRIAPVDGVANSGLASPPSSFPPPRGGPMTLPYFRGTRRRQAWVARRNGHAEGRTTRAGHHDSSARVSRTWRGRSRTVPLHPFRPRAASLPPPQPGPIDASGRRFLRRKPLSSPLHANRASPLRSPAKRDSALSLPGLRPVLTGRRDPLENFFRR